MLFIFFSWFFEEDDVVYRSSVDYDSARVRRRSKEGRPRCPIIQCQVEKGRGRSERAKASPYNFKLLIVRDNSVGMAKKGEEVIDIERYVAQLVAGEIDGHDLARMVHEGILSKSDRRKITKKQSKVKGEKVRQGPLNVFNILNNCVSIHLAPFSCLFIFLSTIYSHKQTRCIITCVYK